MSLLKLLPGLLFLIFWVNSSVMAFEFKAADFVSIETKSAVYDLIPRKQYFLLSSRNANPEKYPLTDIDALITNELGFSLYSSTFKKFDNFDKTGVLLDQLTLSRNIRGLSLPANSEFHRGFLFISLDLSKQYIFNLAGQLISEVSLEQIDESFQIAARQKSRERNFNLALSSKIYADFSSKPLIAPAYSGYVFLYSKQSGNISLVELKTETLQQLKSSEPGFEFMAGLREYVLLSNSTGKSILFNTSNGQTEVLFPLIDQSRLPISLLAVEKNLILLDKPSRTFTIFPASAAFIEQLNLILNNPDIYPPEYIIASPQGVNAFNLRQQIIETLNPQGKVQTEPVKISTQLFNISPVISVLGDGITAVYENKTERLFIINPGGEIKSLIPMLSANRQSRNSVITRQDGYGNIWAFRPSIQKLNIIAPNGTMTEMSLPASVADCQIFDAGYNYGVFIEKSSRIIYFIDMKRNIHHYKIHLPDFSPAFVRVTARNQFMLLGSINGKAYGIEYSINDVFAAGREAFERKLYKTALKNFQLALEIAPDNTELLYYLIFTSHRLNDSNQSKFYAEDLITRFPDSTEAGLVSDLIEKW